MSVRRTWLLLLAATLGAAPARADKLDKDSKKWLDEVRAVILPDEVKTYNDLKDRGERAEFEKIFWARRDPDLGTPENEYKVDFDAKRAEADRRYKLAGRTGSATDCGRLFILLGAPDDVKQDTSGETRGLRLPETWIYKDRPGVTFKGGQVQVALDSECRLANPAASGELDRIASGLIVNPGLAYNVKDGRITRLADLLPKPSPSQELLKNPRQDFPVAGQTGFLRAEGATVVFGLVKADAASLSVEDAAGKKTARVTVVAQAATEDGRVSAFDERAVTAAVEANGSVLAGYRMFLKPGKYTLKFGLHDDKGGKGAVQSQPLEVPDLNKGELSVGTLFIVKDILEEVSSDPKDPLDAYTLGAKTRLIPRFGNAFAKSESLFLFYNVNDGAADPATGKPSLSISVTLSKGSKLLARAPDQDYDVVHVMSSVGPVPLDKYEPGVYTAKLKATDKVANKEATIEQSFEIVP